MGKTSLAHMSHSDGTLFQKNYSMVRASCPAELHNYTQRMFLIDIHLLYMNCLCLCYSDDKMRTFICLFVCVMDDLSLIA